MSFPTEIRPDRKLPENPKAARKPESGRIRAIFGPENPRFPRVSELKKGNLLVYEENIVFECKDLTLIITFYQT